MRNHIAGPMWAPMSCLQGCRYATCQASRTEERMSIFRCYDSDTGESELNLVQIPEGVSVQIGLRDGNDYLSVIIPPDQAVKMAAWLVARFAGLAAREPDHA